MKRKMILDVEKGEALECGCRRGYFLCQKANGLWNEVNRRYEENGYDVAYCDAMDAYYRHYSQSILGGNHQ